MCKIVRTDAQSIISAAILVNTVIISVIIISNQGSYNAFINPWRLIIPHILFTGFRVLFLSVFIILFICCFTGITRSRGFSARASGITISLAKAPDAVG
jgi:hypothetical protein